MILPAYLPFSPFLVVVYLVGSPLFIGHFMAFGRGVDFFHSGSSP